MTNDQTVGILPSYLYVCMRVYVEIVHVPVSIHSRPYDLLRVPHVGFHFANQSKRSRDQSN